MQASASYAHHSEEPQTVSWDLFPKSGCERIVLAKQEQMSLPQQQDGNMNCYEPPLRWIISNTVSSFPQGKACPIILLYQ